MLQNDYLASPTNLTQRWESRRNAIACFKLNRKFVLAHYCTMLVVNLNFSLEHARAALPKPGITGYHFRHLDLVESFDV
jgi:hypothetical protein